MMLGERVPSLDDLPYRATREKKTPVIPPPGTRRVYSDLGTRLEPISGLTQYTVARSSQALQFGSSGASPVASHVTDALAPSEMPKQTFVSGSGAAIVCCSVLVLPLAVGRYKAAAGAL